MTDPDAAPDMTRLAAADADAMRLVPAVARAVMILNHLANGPKSATLAEIARALGLPKSSAHGLCQTLCALKVLREERGQFAIGSAVLPWAGAVIGREDLSGTFRMLLEEVPALAPFTVTLSVLDSGGSVLYLACRNADVPLGITFRIGMRLPWVFTATGKAIAARMPAAELAPMLRAAWPAALTPNSVANAAALQGQLPGIRDRGYSIDREEVREGMVCLGAAILGPDGRPVAGAALSMTATEARPETIAHAGAAIGAFAHKFSAMSGLFVGL
ncbi:IclR family transcriptional regulator [Phaeovulum sp. W22_SRMD_FR3]|uniref:IclR family transcriptional regulator n=1 Tax=Phaeovulum sp. W22_SRMD_FR3 TaxID=3240274 RepID=UPI003F97F194